MDRIQELVTETVKEAKRGVKRKARELSNLDATTKELQAKLQMADNLAKKKDERRRQLHLITSLPVYGTVARHQLSRKNKWAKGNLLALFSSNYIGEIPLQLTEAEWSRSSHAAKFRLDADIFLARLTSSLTESDFEEHYLCHLPHDDNAISVFSVPLEFRENTDIVIAALERYPELLMQNVLSAAMLEDTKVFFAFIRSERHKNPRLVGAGCQENTLSELVAKFSSVIRGTSRYMINAAECIKTNAVVQNINGELVKDIAFAKSLLLTYAEGEIPTENFLRYFESSIRSDVNFVRQLVAKNGRCLRHASRPHRQDHDMVTVACANDASAITFASNSTLLKDKEFVLDALARWPLTTGGETSVYRKFGSELTSDKDVIAAAHAKRCLAFDDVPSHCTEDPEFWESIIGREPSAWFELPQDFQQDIRFARAIPSFSVSTLANNVLAKFQDMRSDRSVWSNIISSQCSQVDEDALVFLLRRHAPPLILQDRELMAQACGEECDVLTLLGQSLLHDRSILEAAINCSGHALRVIPASAQTQHPDLVCAALRYCADDTDHEGFDDDDIDMIATNLWTNLDVADAWFYGHGDLHSLFPVTLKDNEGFGLVLAKKASRMQENHDSAIRFFTYTTSAALRASKSFMMRVVEIEPRVLKSATPDIQHDIDVVLVAFGGDWRSRWLAVGENVEFLRSVFSTAAEKVLAYDGFTKGFLPGFSPRVGTDCPVSVLATDQETSIAFRKKIASYLGVPAGSEMPRLRRVLENLSDKLCWCEYRCCLRSTCCAGGSLLLAWAAGGLSPLLLNEQEEG